MTTRSASVFNITTGNIVWDIDPLQVENNGDVGSAWDANLIALNDSMNLVESEAEDGGIHLALRIVWTDNEQPVLIECPSCESIKWSECFVVDESEDPEMLICDECAFGGEID